MIKIDQLISELILDARNGEQGLTDKYRTRFRLVIEGLMLDKNRITELELKKLLDHTTLIIERYS